MAGVLSPSEIQANPFHDETCSMAVYCRTLQLAPACLSNSCLSCADMRSNSDPLDGAISTIAGLALPVPSYEWGARPAPGLRVVARVSESERCVVIPSLCFAATQVLCFYSTSTIAASTGKVQGPRKNSRLALENL